MLNRDFDRYIQALAAPVLEPMGFTSEGGRGCTFRRKLADDLYHFVQFESNKKGETFEVLVFPGTTLLGPEQWRDFPDFVGVPTGKLAALNAKLGVGRGGSRFPCRDKASLVVAFAAAVRPALERHIEPYLAQFGTVTSIIPHLEHPHWAALLDGGSSPSGGGHQLGMDQV